MTQNYEWRTGRHCVFKNYYHLVFVTKYRRRVFTKEMIERMRQIFAETMVRMYKDLLEFSDDDQVHIMISYHPKLATSKLVGKLKGKSSYFFRKEYWPIIRLFVQNSDPVIFLTRTASNQGAA